MADNKCNYELKGKYNGVYGYTNEELTDKKAEKLVKKHPRGHDLFAVLPSDIQKKIDDRLEIEAKNVAAAKLIAKDTMLDKQLRAEEDAKKLIRKDAIAKGEKDAKEKRQARKKKLELRNIKK